MNSTPSTRLCGVVLVVIALITLGMVCWLTPEDKPVEGVMDARIGDGGASLRSAGDSGPVADVRLMGEPGIPLADDTSMAALRQGGQYESLGAALVEARHAVEKIDPDGLHSRGAEYFAANPGEQLRAWFSGDGVELASGIPTPEDEETWSLKLRLTGIGRGQDLAPVVPGTVTGEGGHVEVVHAVPGNLECGDQPRRGADTALDSSRSGFAKRPQCLIGGGSGGAIQSGVNGRPSLATALMPGEMQCTRVTQWFENRSDGLEQGFTFQEPPAGCSGEMTLLMECEGTLHVEAVGELDGVRFVDATGAEVLHYTGLKAWDANGRTLLARMEVRGSDALALVVDDARARYPVTIDPMFVNVEARMEQGSVEGDQFGYSVALDGETALVGAPFHDSVIGEDAGCAYVLVRDGTVWRPQAKLMASDAGRDDRFGTSVALSGSTALIGAHLDDTVAGEDAGSAYLFVRSGMTWSEEAQLLASDAAAHDEFGASVALAGETALVGADHDETSAGTFAGSAYVFVRSGAVWSQEVHLTADDGAAGDAFGTSVALSGDRALIGARNCDTPEGALTGAAYVFGRDGMDWSQEAKLVTDHFAATMPYLPDYFGFSVALSGDTALVGAYQDDTSAGWDAGSAFVFVRSGTTWSQQAVLTPDDGEGSDNFGYSVALSGDTALVGMRVNNRDRWAEAASAYVFTRVGTSWSQEASLTATDVVSGDLFGCSVALSGDTALVGARFDDPPAGLNAGSAHVFTRTGTAWAQEAGLTAADTAAGTYLGLSVALSGGTALVSAPNDSAPVGSVTGSVYVFERTGTAWIRQVKLTADDAAENDQFGMAVALDGGTALIGAIGDDMTPGPNSGSVYVYVRTGSSWTRQAKLVAGDAEPDDGYFGWCVALSGDTALVGARYDNTPAGAAAGSAYVYVRTGTTWSQEAKLAAEDAAEHDYFGSAVALSGDTALVGTAVGDTSSGGPSSAYVFTRVGTTWSQEAKLGDEAGSFGLPVVGAFVALSGDLALVGAPFDNTSAGTNAGSVHVYVRTGTAWNRQAILTAGDAMENDQFGTSVALSGDTVLVGAPGNQWSTVSGGNAYVFAPRGAVWVQEAKLTAGVDASLRDLFGVSVAISGGSALVGAPGNDTEGADAGSAYAFLLGDLPEITQHPQSRTVVPGQSVSFSVTATGHEPLAYQWRMDGYPIDGATVPGYTINSAQVADQGVYDCVVSNAGGVVTSAAAMLTVNDLSEFLQSFPGSPPEASGLVLVNLSPPGVVGAWRFAGELRWRSTGTAASGLTTGDRVIEFRPVPGYLHPPAETVSVVSGGAVTVVDRSYYQAGTAGSGGVSVTLKPDALAESGVPEADRAQWRFLGEDGTRWRDSGVTVPGLVPGTYLIECKVVDGRTTPSPAKVLVEDGQTAAPILTYYLEHAQTGTEPLVLAFEVVATSTDLPYAYVGQIRSDVGASTGFVVKPRVVATAGHVVFNDGTLATVTGLQWLFQRDRGSYEPAPQTPRGFYLFDGYSAQRIAEGTPGSSSPASQELDVAALYFDDPAGRDGFSGFLASDAVPNEWVSAGTQKILVGYPVVGVPANQAGRMHATPAGDVSLVPGGSPHTYTTSDIRSTGGSSGGPLCVQFEGGAYYPAAIYLGGTGQTVVRVIDSEVIRLFDAAEDSAATGNNNTGGGITLTSVTPVGTPSDPGILKVTVEPAAARAAGGGWRLVPESSYRQSGSQKAGLNPGTYTMEMSTVTGFQTPTQQTVSVIGGSLNEITFTYAVENSELDAWRQTHFGTTANTGDAADSADPDGDGSPNIDEFTAGTDPNDPNDVLRALTARRVEIGFTLEVAGKAGRIYEMQLNEDGLGGTWTTRASVGPLAADVGLSLTDPVAPPDHGYYRVRVSKP